MRVIHSCETKSLRSGVPETCLASDLAAFVESPEAIEAPSIGLSSSKRVSLSDPLMGQSPKNNLRNLCGEEEVRI